MICIIRKTTGKTERKERREERAVDGTDERTVWPMTEIAVMPVYGDFLENGGASAVFTNAGNILRPAAAMSSAVVYHMHEGGRGDEGREGERKDGQEKH